MSKKSFFSSKNFVVNEWLIKEAVNQTLDINDFLVLIVFVNSENKKLDIQKTTEYLGLSEEQVLNSLNSLMSKKLISLVSEKDETGKISDFVQIDRIVELIEEVMNNETNKQPLDLYSKFEKEFGRTISPMEYELINGWQENGFTQDLILQALREATYNGVNNIRYVDKVLYEWKKKGFKTPEDVDKHVKGEKNSQKNDDLFDVDWINMNDEEE